MLLRRAVLAVAFVLFVPLTAQAQDKAADATIKKVEKLQADGRHDKALKALEKFFAKKDWTPRATALKATSLDATGKTADAFKVAAAIRKTPEGKTVLATIGPKLPDQALKIKSTPAGASISIDGAEKGKTPADVQLKPGFHKVEITLDGHSSFSNTIFLNLGQTGYLSPNLVAQNGTLTFDVDAPGLKASVVGSNKSWALKDGKTTVSDAPAGSIDIALHDGKGAKVHEASVRVPAGGNATMSYRTKARVTTTLKDATIEVESKDESKAKDKKAAKVSSLVLTEGKHTLILKQPGHYPIKGDLSVTAGQDVTLLNQPEKIPNRDSLELWSIVGVSVGLTAVAVATALELGDIGEEGSLDVTKFTLAGAGGALFVAGGALLKWVRDEKSKPTAKDGAFQIKVGATALPSGAMVGAAGSF